MSPNYIKRLGNYQFAIIASWFSSSSPWRATYHSTPAISSATYLQMTGRIDNDLWSTGLIITSSNTSPKSHSTAPATSQASAASTKTRSELPLKADNQNYLMAGHRQLLQRKRHCQRRQELYWHNCAQVTAESLVSTWSEWTESTRSAQPLSPLLSFASWHPSPFRLPFEADHTNSRIAMDCSDHNREVPLFGDWWGELTTTT